MWYVYFLRLNNDNIYVGSTNDLKRRFASHQAGQVLSTKAFLPAKLKSYVAVEDEGQASELERYFKSGSPAKLSRVSVSGNKQSAKSVAR
jgi:predicted GIY-YIG superfamily endonuclease